MAESASPSLPSTADTTPYVPVSWLAVTALAVACTFAATLLALGAVAFTSKKPLIEDWLLAMPAVAIVLSFAARRVIRTSEGTRTGENLANYAWWTAVVFGLCYIAYLFAIDFAVRRDARREVERWVGLAVAGTPKDGRVAFLRTRPPGDRQGVSPDDEFQIERRYRSELLAFRTSDLMKIVGRNKGAVQFDSRSVTWAYRPGMIDGVVQGVVTCAEGTFPVVVPVRAIEGVSAAEGGARQWMIAWQPGTGFIEQARAERTPYGWHVAVLEADGGGYGREYVKHQLSGPGSQPFAYRAFVAPGGDRAGWSAIAVDPLAQLAFAVPARAALGDAGRDHDMANTFFRLPDGRAPSPDQKALFFGSLYAQGLRHAGEKLKDAGGGVLDKEDVLSVTDSAVEVRVPVEIPLMSKGQMEVTRGRVVVACTDPAVLAELKALKASADPKGGSASPPAELRQRRVTWRVVGVESDLMKVTGGPPAQPPPGGGMGGPGG